jgi:hypothetical protein
VAEAPVESVGALPDEAPRLIGCRLSEVALLDIGEAEVRRLAETGALWAAEEGLIEEEDLPLFAADASDADSLGRRSLAAGARDWTRPGQVRALRVAEILDSEGAEALGLEPGALALVVSAGAEDLDRLALVSHRERISARTAAGDFGAPDDLPAVPMDTGEARDLLAAAVAAANYAAGRAALLTYALRQALREVGSLGLRVAWAVGGLEERDGWVLHRNGLSAVGARDTLAAGLTIAAGTGKMLGSVPPFEVPEEDGRWVWEEAGLLERWAVLEPLGGWSGEVVGWPVDLLMVRDPESGRFVYVEQMERRRGETPWEYARRSFRREGEIRTSFAGETLEVIVGWGMSSVEEFLRAYPEYGPGDAAGNR